MSVMRLTVPGAEGAEESILLGASVPLGASVSPPGAAVVVSAVGGSVPKGTSVVKSSVGGSVSSGASVSVSPSVGGTV